MSFTFQLLLLLDFLTHSVNFVSFMLEEAIDLHFAKSSCQTATHAKGNFVGNNNRGAAKIDVCQKIKQ